MLEKSSRSRRDRAANACGRWRSRRSRRWSRSCVAFQDRCRCSKDGSRARPTSAEMAAASCRRDRSRCCVSNWQRGSLARPATSQHQTALLEWLQPSHQPMRRPAIHAWRGAKSSMTRSSASLGHCAHLGDVQHPEIDNAIAPIVARGFDPRCRWNARKRSSTTVGSWPGLPLPEAR